jgi:hypothetical protein
MVYILDKGVDYACIFDRMNITLDGTIEHGPVGGIIDRLPIVVVHPRLASLIGDKISIVNGDVADLSLTPSEVRGIFATGWGAAIEHVVRNKADTFNVNLLATRQIVERSRALINAQVT